MRMWLPVAPLRNGRQGRHRVSTALPTCLGAERYAQDWA
jgi:hypothetical protein